MTWASVADVTTAPRELTIEERAAVDDVLDAAAAWAAGALPLTEALHVGYAVSPAGHESPAWSRYLAVRTTSSGDPRRRDLLRLIDAALTLRGLVVTGVGVIGRAELAESDRQVDAWRANGGDTR